MHELQFILQFSTVCCQSTYKLCSTCGAILLTVTNSVSQIICRRSRKRTDAIMAAGVPPSQTAPQSVLFLPVPKQRLLLYFIGAVVIVILLHLVATKCNGGNIKQPPEIWTQNYTDPLLLLQNDQQHNKKNFLYLLQTENCLPENLKPLQALGNGTDRDVLVLSYRRVCNLQPPSLAHVKYIYDNSTTWSTGRNLLYDASQNRKAKYLFYIFLDDDVVLDIKNNPKKVNPWRKFEEFLLRVEPAVGIADDSGNRYVPAAEKSRKKLKCELPNKVEYVPSPRFDACFNAFHRKAINHLLPYLPKFDKTSWWFSSRFIEAKCEVVFPGQVVIHTYIRAINSLHRKYPRIDATKQDEALIYNELEKTIPPKY